MNISLKQVRQSIVHVLDEWAEAPPNTTEMSPCVHSDSLSKPDCPMNQLSNAQCQCVLICLSNAGEGEMENNLPLNGSIDLDALDDYLMSDHAPDDSMGLSDLDGFLTGIVVGPELIPPSEWLPVIWGGEEPVFQTEEEMRAVLGTIMGRYNEIVGCLVRTLTTVHHLHGSAGTAAETAESDGAVDPWIIAATGVGRSEEGGGRTVWMRLRGDGSWIEAACADDWASGRRGAGRGGG
jgi:hypothetical protein